ncbi:MAG: ATP-dependent dethiobiotin synthetase BioD [Mesorhizobium sp.]|uniref:dethiobiotin synthase n=1 Tax=Mesorhizobium sp. TaxID=1871066 RepID=UPI000FE30F49|nr:dethiobiotin synthase [Mesorhizobium sp.]RWK18586.1 MAG: ATP-dependent dethiobiotin synthetase BioD [Mesorhizobium sp.]RWK27860.1 MAG: ATP-dependent dethiobiotin synthetase BioD [Mesorhizobium sp.]TIQ42707.1 MAG: ATP-dependent dethiobiotin synthetase BioD [Mesorhizobium sp.]TIQ56490.1 MAG: ATP-dependent dethiobiotin synthetase BioD [Mesorhizobium sp.]
MTARIVVTGTDTGVGKTVFSAGLAGLLDGFYWKPVQSGLDEETDSEVVARLSGLPAGRVVPEVYRLKMPLSPHRSAEIDGVAIEAARLSLPKLPGPLIIEGAGGLMVPLNRQTRFIDIFREWQLPVILCARTALGTINHTLLSLEAMRARSIPLLGIAFIGDEMADTQKTIAEMGKVRILGRLPRVDPLTPEALLAAMRASFNATDFTEGRS